MKRKISCLLLAFLLLSALALPTMAYVRISYGLDCLAPECTLTKTALCGDDFTFSEADFKQALGLGRISSVTLLTLPDSAAGVLTLGGYPVIAGQVIEASALPSLIFTPADGGFEGAEFRFTVNAGAGGAAYTCLLRTADAINHAPTVKDVALKVSTQEDIAVFGVMSATDPEGDALTYHILSYPQNGTLSRVDRTSGEFCYTPHADYTGEDRFVYVARDEYGNYSAPVTVPLTVKRRTATLVYADMTGHPAHNAALALAEKNILLGTLVGDGMYFSPDREVTRADFLVMAMKAAGISPAAGVTRTWFDDDGALDSAVRPYVATAQLMGIVCGSFDGDGLYFHPDRAITRAEAAVILDAMVDTATPTVLPVFADQRDIPVWARQSMSVLYAVGIFDTARGNYMQGADAMTRADCAEVLLAVMEYEK